MPRHESSADGTNSRPTDGDASDGAVETVRRVLGPVVDAWMTVVRAFSWVVARVVAVVMFVVAFVPYSIVMRLVDFDPLDRDTDVSAESYWTEFEASNSSLEQFRKLY